MSDNSPLLTDEGKVDFAGRNNHLLIILTLTHKDGGAVILAKVGSIKQFKVERKNRFIYFSYLVCAYLYLSTAIQMLNLRHQCLRTVEQSLLLPVQWQH